MPSDAERSFKVPVHDLLELKSFEPKTWDQLIEAFEAWLTKGGEDGRQAYLIRCLSYCQHPLPQNMAVLDTVMAIQSGVLTWVGSQLADMESFVTHAQALAIDEVKTDIGLTVLWESMLSAERTARVNAKVAIFIRWRDQFKRLHEAVGKRISAGQTLSANTRKEQGGNGPGSAGYRP